ncbi:unnamed protein product [Soboliphyme baturini]|uniref:Solute carrier family 40 protein n=1 Tax=Soboliphyme baturini TaxID=241478 RepID=A0A183ITD4_9BILA|nr:unnamed protein product [Soboliphyme baturini]
MTRIDVSIITADLSVKVVTEYSTWPGVFGLHELQAKQGSLTEEKDQEDRQCSQKARVANSVQEGGTAVCGVHICFFQIVAALALGASLESNAATGFLYTIDKTAHSTGRLVTSTLTMFLVIYGHYILDVFSKYYAILMVFSGLHVVYWLVLRMQFRKVPFT